MDVEQNRITVTLNELVNALNSHADRLLRSNFDLTYSQFLFLLSLTDGDKNLTESAKFQGVSVAAVSKRIEWFTQRKLVTCQQATGRGNQSILRLTSKGRTLASKSLDFLEEQFRDSLTDVPGVNLAALDQQLEKLLNHFYACTDSE